MSDAAKLSAEYLEKAAKLAALEEFLKNCDRAWETTRSRIRVYKNSKEMAQLHKDIADIDRWSRNVKIVRAAAVGAWVSLALGPVAVAKLTAMGLTALQAQLAVGATGIMVGGIVQTLASSSGGVPGSSLAIVVAKAIFIKDFEDRLKGLPRPSVELVMVSPADEFDYIMQVEQDARREAVKASNVSDLQFYAKNKLLREYWDARYSELLDWWEKTGNNLKTHVLPKLRGETARAKVEMELALKERGVK